jgi:hypothetical protein
MEVIPLNVVPITGVSTTTTTSTTTGEIPAATSVTAPDATDQLAKSDGRYDSARGRNQKTTRRDSKSPKVEFHILGQLQH